MIYCIRSNENSKHFKEENIMVVKTFNSEALFGYKQITTFFEDFSIADRFGISAIKDTYKRAFKGWKDNVEYITELDMVLNWKSWQFAPKEQGGEDNDAYCKLYSDLYYELRDWCFENLKGDDLEYYIRTTD